MLTNDVVFILFSREIPMTKNDPTNLHSGKSHLTIWLGYLGLIPFIIPLWQMVALVEQGLGVHGASLFGLYAPYVFISYSAIILSFLGGILWTKGRFNDPEKVSKPAIVFSNIMALSAWASLILINYSSMLTMFALTLLLGGYGSLLLAERALDMESQDKSYWRMRLILTMIVIVAHSLVLAFLIREI